MSGVSPRAAAIILIVTGAVALLVGLWQWLGSGPGSGFKGHTPGFRAKVYALVVLGFFGVAGGVFVLLRLPR